MTTERKPSERAVELSDNALKAGQECMYSVVPSRFWNDDCATKLAAIISKHFPPSMEDELAEALRDVLSYVGPLGTQPSAKAGAVSNAKKLLTTYHQRKETK